MLGWFKKLLGTNQAPPPKKPPDRVLKREDRSRAPKVLPKKRRSGIPFLKFPRFTEKPYALARKGRDGYIDRRVGERPERLEHFGLPRLSTPEDLAGFLKIPVRTLAYLAGHPAWADPSPKQCHYHYVWKKKRGGQGHRLIEAPKGLLKFVQKRVLREILDRVPAHPAAHGFARGRSILSHARAHTGKYVILKADLADFYPSIGFKRVLACFRGMGYNAEVSWWLARICCNRAPLSVLPPGAADAASAHDARMENRGVTNLALFRKSHLPQGSPASPALANLAAFSLDVRLAGLARKFGVTYTRYADDLIFSGEEALMGRRGMGMTALIRYIRAIVAGEKFLWNGRKKTVVRRGGRQMVTGLTVNEKANVPRPYYDQLKAILTNGLRRGPASQNRDRHHDFRTHLAGRIAFVRSVSPGRADKLQKIFDRIQGWS